MAPIKYEISIDQRFGRGVVTELVRVPGVSRITANGFKTYTQRGAKLLCNCGNYYTTSVGNLFKPRPTLSCGCLVIEHAIKIGHANAGSISNETEQSFYQIVREANATVKGEYTGVSNPIHIVCVAGHNAFPRPESVVYKGQGLCSTCAYIKSSASQGSNKTWQIFCGIVEEANATIQGAFKGTHKPIHIICEAGHNTYPCPRRVVHDGISLCGQCYVMHDIFYVVTRAKDGGVKLGITSGEPKKRLCRHAYEEFNTVEFLVTSLPPGMADDTETRILKDLKSMGHYPVKGREYFGPEAQDIILKLARQYLSDYEMHQKGVAQQCL